MRKWRELRSRLRNMDEAQRSQMSYLAEAALENCVLVTMADAFLTLLIKQLGVSDAVTGVLSSLTILACGMQMFAVGFIRRRRSIRRTVAGMDTVHYLLYAFLFLLPLLPLPEAVRVPLFAGLFLLGSIIMSLTSTTKFNWLMSFVPPERRGAFTAHREMLAMAAGMVYNLVMSRVLDFFVERNAPQTGLAVVAAVLTGIALLHLLTLLKTADAPQLLQSARDTVSLAAAFRTNFANPGFVRALVVAAGWNFFMWMSFPYTSLFMLQEVGSTVTFIGVTAAVAAAVRFVFSPLVGRICDRHGFARGVRLGLIMSALAHLVLVFWQPGNGRALYLCYRCLDAVDQAALTGGILTLLFQYVPVQHRVGALGIYGAIAGLVGFAGSLAGGRVLQLVQSAGNRLWGIPLYGQQLNALITAAGIFGLVLFNLFVLEKTERVE